MKPICPDCHTDEHNIKFDCCHPKGKRKLCHRRKSFNHMIAHCPTAPLFRNTAEVTSNESKSTNITPLNQMMWGLNSFVVRVVLEERYIFQICSNKVSNSGAGPTTNSASSRPIQQSKRNDSKTQSKSAEIKTRPMQRMV